MYSSAEISPNEPDVVPDYVDGKPTAATAVAEAPPAPKQAEVPAAKIPPAEQPRPEPTETASAAAPETVAHRDGECVPNVPDVDPALISSAEQKALDEQSAPPPVPDLTPPASPWWKWHLTATVLLAGIFGLLVFSQAVSAFAFAASLPQWAQYTLIVPFSVCCLAVLWVCASLVRSWFRLRAMRQIDLGALEQLRLRAQTRQDGVEHFHTARAQLESYLKTYPLSAEFQPKLVRAGLSQAQIDSLVQNRDFLVGRAQDSRTWLVEFRDQYQATLDEAAAARTSAWSIKAAGCVIASPLPLLDAILVLGISLKLIKDLATIYNVRTGRAGSLIILNKAIAAAFIAGVAEEATEAAGDLAAEQLTGLVGESTLNSLGAKMVGVVTPKLGEGAINALFIRRLGRATVRLLQPARPR